MRGLGVLLPPLLTVVILLWIYATVQSYVLRPVESGARYVLLWKTAEIYDSSEVPADLRDDFVALGDGTSIPKEVRQFVSDNPVAREKWEERGGKSKGRDIYAAYVDAKYLRPQVVIPVFVITFLAVMYLLGNFLAAGLGRAILELAERAVLSLPLVRNVYGSVKQVTDFMFTETELEFSRVVAVEYPRRGIWSIGFVTGESFQDIHSAANEPCLSILIPTSPMPVTGYTVNCLKSEVIDLDITIDQALQFTISCGVVIPENQLPKTLKKTTLIDEHGSSSAAAATASNLDNDHQV